MSTVVVGEQDWLSEIIAERRRLGQDMYDEVWEGVYHMAPNAASQHASVAAEIISVLRGRARERGLRSTGPFNLGTSSDFRVPDAGWHHEMAHASFLATAVAVLEVLSPGDETYAKFDFYRAHGVAEVLVAHPLQRWVRCHRLQLSNEPHTHSHVFDIDMDALIEAVDWP